MNIINKKAKHDFYVLDSLECGVVLRGNEVKSIRNGSCDLRSSWCYIKNGELFVTNMTISKCMYANDFDVSERRDIKLLANKRELVKLSELVSEQGTSLVPLSVYFLNGRVKLELGICKGKKNYDKRETLKERDSKRAIEIARKGEFTCK